MNRLNYINSNLSVILVASMSVFVCSAILWSSISVCALIALLSFVTFFFVHNNSSLSIYTSIAIVCFYIIMLLTYYGCIDNFGTPYYGGGSDDYNFEKYAHIYNSNNWFDFTQEHGYSVNTRLYVFLLQLIFLFSDLFDGYHSVLPRLLNGYIYVWCICLAYYLMKQYLSFSERSCKKALLFLSTNVYILYICAFTFRDPLCLFFSLLVIVFTANIFNKNTSYFIRIMFCFFICFIVFLSYYLRGQWLFVQIGLIIIVLISYRKNYKFLLFSFIIIFVLLFCIDAQFNLIGIFRPDDLYSDYYSASNNSYKFVFSVPLLPFGIFMRFLYGLIWPFPNYLSLFVNQSSFLLDICLLMQYLYGVLLFTKLLNLFYGFIKRNYSTKCLILWLYYFILVTCSTFTFRHFMFPFFFYAILIGDLDVRIPKKIRICNCFVMLFVYFLIQVIYVLSK